MKVHEASVEAGHPRAFPAWLSGERLAWIAAACLAGALFLVRWNAAPGQGPLVANPLALVLFATLYVLIRLREAGGRL